MAGKKKVSSSSKSKTNGIDMPPTKGKVGIMPKFAGKSEPKAKSRPQKGK